MFKKYSGLFKLALIYLFLLVFISLLYLYTPLSLKINNLFLLIIAISFFFINGYLSGQKAVIKGYLSGLKKGLILLLIFFLLSLFKSSFSYLQLLYYLILLLSSVLGSCFGINHHSTIKS